MWAFIWIYRHIHVNPYMPLYVPQAHINLWIPIYIYIYIYIYIHISIYNNINPYNHKM